MKFFYALFSLYISVFAIKAQDANVTLNDAQYYVTFESDIANNTSIHNAPMSSSATSTHSCNSVRAVPASVRSGFNLDYFYTQYTEAYGIPILASSRVSAKALKRTCYTVRFMFADIKGVRDSYLKYKGRFAVMATNEVTTNIPEHKNLGPGWDQRARGLGATIYRPVSTCGEENVLCLNNDRYRVEDIALHEFSHGLHLLGAKYAISGFQQQLQAAYNSAKSRGLWARTYAMQNANEYWAEGVQSYFNVNAYSATPNGIHNHVNTREKLKTYDPTLYNLIKKTFPCNNEYIDRCKDKDSGFTLSENQKLKVDCSSNGGGDPEPEKKKGCTDNDKNCASWAKEGYCKDNEAYMSKNCRRSCGLCPNETCKDLHKDCQAWVKSGHCQKSKKSMAYWCRKACNFC